MSSHMTETSPRHILVYSLQALYPFRHILMSMLRPIDLISLVMAVGIRLSFAEKRRFLVWTKQLFLDMQWVERLQWKNCNVMLIGQKIHWLCRAIKRGDYTFDTTHLRMIIAISKRDSDITDYSAISKSFDPPDHCAGSPLTPGEPASQIISMNNEHAPIHVAFVKRGSFIDFDRSLSDKICTKMHLDAIALDQEFTGWFINYYRIWHIKLVHPEGVDSEQYLSRETDSTFRGDQNLVRAEDQLVFNHFTTFYTVPGSIDKSEVPIIRVYADKEGKCRPRLV